MYKRIYLIALVPNSQSNSNAYTVYLFEKEEKIVLPVNLAKHEIRYLFKKRGHKFPLQQNIYDTTVRILLGLEAKVISVSIYKYQNQKFYAYLNIIHSKNYLEISIKFSDSLKIANRFEIPIFIRRDILLNEGIKVTKKLLKDALRGETNLPDTY